VVAGVSTGNLPLMLWCIAIGGIGLASLGWERLAWKGVEVEAAFLPNRAFGGEPVNLRVRIRNTKRIPLPLVKLTARLPRGLAPDEETHSAFRGHYRRLSLPGRSEATLDLPVRTVRRGEFRLEGIDIELSDPFDILPVMRTFGKGVDLLVLPEARITIDVPVLRRLPFGHPAPSAARVYEDRERFAGVRGYEAGDPLNRIHWKLSAHAGELQTKLYEPTRSAEALLVVDLSAGEPFWDNVFPTIAEDAIGWASFLARAAMDAGWRVGLVANTHLRRGGGALRIRPSTAPGHEAALFAALARMPDEPTADMAPVIREVGRRLGRGTSAIVISARPGPALLHELAVLRRRGVDVVQVSPLDAREDEVGA
jgi:uncharacterized protein (DUF58 family)